MRLLAVTAALWLFALAIPALAQVEISAQTERSQFLLYERVDLVVSIVNGTESDVLLDNNEGHPWLSFLVSRHTGPNYLPVKEERASNFQPLTIKAGETKLLRVNLTPLFAFRSEGNYRASAVLDLPGQGQVISDFVPFSVVKGAPMWSQSRPVEGSERTYTLIRFSPNSDHTQIYLRVEDPAENTVYANVGLGEMVALINPDVFFDPEGNIHILHPIALGTYAYTRANPDGKIVLQRIFKTYLQVPPRLRKLEDGNVIVAGGLEENPDQPQEKLSNGQVGAKAPLPPGSPHPPPDMQQH